MAQTKDSRWVANPVDEARTSRSHAVLARSVLYLPFRWDLGGAASSPEEMAEVLARRRLPGGREGAADVPFWTVVESRPMEAEQLDPAHRAVLGAADAGNGRRRACRLALHDSLRDGWLASARLGQAARTGASAQSEGLAVLDRFAIGATGAGVWLFPLGTGVLLFEVEWTPRGAPIALDDLVRRLWMLRHLDVRSRSGWTFEARLSPARRAVVPPGLAAAWEHTGVVALREVADWLLALPGEDPARPVPRTSALNYALHQSALLLPAEPTDAETTARLFQLRRGFDLDYPPPPDGIGPDVVLEPRGNRRIGISREGVVSLTWPVEGCDLAFESQNWVPKFLGIYLLLVLHAHAERVALSGIADDMARAAVDLDPGAIRTEDRDALLHLVARITRATAVLTAVDCGGVSDYGEVYRGVRRVLYLDEHLAEVRAEARELADLTNLVTARMEQQQDRVFQHRFTALGAVAVPFAVVSGLLGMNLPDEALLVPSWLGPQVGPFATVVSTCAVVGLAVMAALWPRAGKRR